MPTEMFNHCLLCNPEVNWLEVELRSERNEPITGLTVRITNPSSGQTLKKSAPQGRVRFENIVAAEWVVNVDTDTLLSKVEQYASRKDNEDSPVRTWTKEQKDCCGNPKAYYHVTVGDLWESPPKDSFLVENHGPSKKNYRDESKGFRTSHNRSSVLEIKALRSYMPMIVDTDEFSLVNSYTFALLSQQAYGNNDFGDSRNKTYPQGGHTNLLKTLQSRQRPSHAADREVTWLLDEVPYSQALKGEFYHDDTIGSEGYIFSNDKIAIIGVRGTETYFTKDDVFQIGDLKVTPTVMNKAFPFMKITEVVDGVIAAVGSPGYQDVMTDIDASQEAPPEFGGAYVHRGFYQYAMGLWDIVRLKSQLLESKKIYICGHSLGGAGALLLGSLIQDTYVTSSLRLYTYGMPRAGTYSFVQRYHSIVHYRHVNNHDVVPQVPMRWMNTNPDEKSGQSSFKTALSQSAKVSTPSTFASTFAILYLWDSLKERVVDSDDDNYQHHGSLIQLLTFSQAKHYPEAVKQVLLTHRQTHISSLTLASNKSNDAYLLAETLSHDHIDINGYKTTIKESGADHALGEYIPNFKQQLALLLEDKSTLNYQTALQTVLNTEQLLIDVHSELEKDELNALAMQYITRKDPAAHIQRENSRSQALFAIRQEKKLTEKITLNVQRVRKELETLIQMPELLSSETLLFGDQTAEIELVREQIQ